MLLSKLHAIDELPCIECPPLHYGIRRYVAMHRNGAPPTIWKGGNKSDKRNINEPYALENAKQVLFGSYAIRHRQLRVTHTTLTAWCIGIYDLHPKNFVAPCSRVETSFQSQGPPPDDHYIFDLKARKGIPEARNEYSRRRAEQRHRRWESTMHIESHLLLSKSCIPIYSAQMCLHGLIQRDLAMVRIPNGGQGQVQGWPRMISIYPRRRCNFCFRGFCAVIRVLDWPGSQWS